MTPADDRRPSVVVDGLRIAYERVGEGPPVVLLHGYVGDGSTTWRRQLDGLDDFTLVAWDAPGAGQSADPPETFGMAGYADCLAGFVAELGLERPDIVGLSFGGALALELVRRHPTIARRLVLVSAYAGWAGSLPADVAAERLRQSLALADLSPDELVDALLPTMFSAGTPPDVVESFRASVRAFHPIGFRAMARASAEDLRDALPCVDLPTLLVYGTDDVRAPLTVAEHIRDAIAGSTLVTLPGVGHVCNVEAADRFNRAVREFLLRSPPARARRTSGGGRAIIADVTPTYPALRTVVLDATDARTLAEFWRRLLGFEYRPGDEPPPEGEPDTRGQDWLVLRDRAGETRLAVQWVESLPASTWPTPDVPQQLHLDLTVADIEELTTQRARAIALGATLRLDRSGDPDEPLYVFADPAGHPFCIFVSPDSPR